MSWIKKIVFNSALILGSSISGLFLFEFFLIFENRFKPVEKTVVEINGESYPFLKGVSTEGTLQKSSKSRHLFILGDSFTEGIVCAADNANFPSHLSEMIGADIEVINLGVNGKNTADYVDFLDYFEVVVGDLAIITLYDNDMIISERNCGQIRRQAEKHEVYVPKFCSSEKAFVDKSSAGLLKVVNKYVKDFKTVQLLKESAAQVPALQGFFYRDEYRNSWNDFKAEENKWLRSSLRVMQEQVQRAGGNVIFTYYPNTNNITRDDYRHQIWTRFLDYAEEQDGIKILDPYPYFVAVAPEKSMVWSLTDKHPNCAAHKIMAEFLMGSARFSSILEE